MARVACFIAVCLAALAGEARATERFESDVPLAEQRIIPYSGVVPACDDAFVLAEIASDLSNASLGAPASVAAWPAVEELGYRANGLSYIPRRYCTALAQFGGGAVRRVGYVIGEDLGFAGIGWGVNWRLIDY